MALHMEKLHPDEAGPPCHKVEEKLLGGQLKYCEVNHLPVFYKCRIIRRHLRRVNCPLDVIYFPQLNVQTLELNC